MTNKSKLNKLKVLSSNEVSIISEKSFKVLKEIGVKVPNKRIWKPLKNFGVLIDEKNCIAKFSESSIEEGIKLANKKHIIYGRDKEKTARFGYEEFNFNGSSGQYKIIDKITKKRRSTNIEDLRNSIKVGDCLNHINVVGAMVVPSDISPELQSVITFFELLKGTTKPFTGWIFDSSSAKAIIEMMRIVRGSSKELSTFPLYEAFIEPISPLTYRSESIDIMIEFANADIPISIGPMVQTGTTGPIDIAGTIVLENAEIISGIVMTQAIKPGLPVTYGGIPHIFDMKTGMISFGSPEQGLMAAAITQIAKSYGFPVYNNTGMCDAKLPDIQAGIEKASTLIFGMMSGGDIFGHLGISGADNGANLAQLIIDNEMIAYLLKIFNSFEVNGETTSFEIIKRVGIGKNYLMDSSTLSKFNNDIWYPEIFDRFVWDSWEKNGSKEIYEKAIELENKILKEKQENFLDDDINKECKKLISSFKKNGGVL